MHSFIVEKRFRTTCRRADDNSPTPLKIEQAQPTRLSSVKREKCIPTVRLQEPYTYRMVIDLAISALLEEPEVPRLADEPAFFSKIFQNLRLSSAAAVASIWPSGLRQL